jgi:hypothetical protein
MSVGVTALQGRQKLSPVGHARRAARSAGPMFEPVVGSWTVTAPVDGGGTYVSFGAPADITFTDPGTYRVTVNVTHFHGSNYTEFSCRWIFTGAAVVRLDGGGVFRTSTTPTADGSDTHVAYFEVLNAGDTLTIDPQYRTTFTPGVHNLSASYAVERAY